MTNKMTSTISLTINTYGEAKCIAAYRMNAIDGEGLTVIANNLLDRPNDWDADKRASRLVSAGRFIETNKLPVFEG
jgi:hypothetical protein